MKKNTGNWRIAWQSRITKFQGGGQFFDTSSEDGLKIIDDLNRRHPDLEHWLERNPAYSLEPEVLAEHIQQLERKLKRSDIAAKRLIRLAEVEK